ncbi:MAG: hypothetical protein LIO41_06160 [Ruminococcus sp.]|nr:hypothetical protein [Ruminococcus sp.]
MADKVNLKAQLDSYKFEFGLLQKVPCSKEDNNKYQNLQKNGGGLPVGVYSYSNGDVFENDTFYTVYEPYLTETEKQDYLTLKKLNMIKTIKNCAIFFTVLAVISLICGFLSIFTII